MLSGILFALLDGIINGNRISQRLMECYKPIAKTNINISIGFSIDMFFGFAMCAIFVLLYDSIPGETGFAKGIAYGFIIWFFRVFMSVFTIYMTQKVPIKTLAYMLITGFLEVQIIGIFYGLTLRSYS